MARLTRGERFKDARIVHNQHKKQTMDEVSAATSVSKSLIQSLEDDSVNRSVGYDKVAKLAAHYNVTTDYLLGLSDDPTPMRSAVDDLGLSPKAVEWIEGLEKKAHCSNHDDRISVLNYLLESIDFQLFFYNLCEFYYSSRAEAIYNALFDLAFPRMEGDEDIVTQEMGDRFRAKLAQILDAHHIPNEIRDYLAATSDLWGRQSLGDSRLVDVLMGVEGFNVSDLPEFRVNRDFSTLMESVRQHATEQGTIGILPEGVVESMR